MTQPIYLDNHATTPLDPVVYDAMRPYFGVRFGNPSSRTHSYGRDAAIAVEAARAELAALIGARPQELIWTSGATESNNLALWGVFRASAPQRDHLVTVATEHKAVLDPCHELARAGFRVTVLPVDGEGRVDPDAVARALTDRTALVSVMAANNEVGVLQPLAEIGRLCRARGVLLHTDAAQALGKVPFNVAGVDVDLASFSAHKLYGPKGVGALYAGSRARLSPMQHGGGQERGLRAGTLNVPGIVGFGRAAAVASAVLGEEAGRLRAMRDRLWRGMSDNLDEVRLNGPLLYRLPGNLNVSFGWVEGEALRSALPELAVSATSACQSESGHGSHVLAAMGVPEGLARSAIRFGIGRFNTEREIDRAIELVVAAVMRLRADHPRWRPERG